MQSTHKLIVAIPINIPSKFNDGDDDPLRSRIGREVGRGTGVIGSWSLVVILGVESKGFPTIPPYRNFGMVAICIS